MLHTFGSDFKIRNLLLLKELLSSVTYTQSKTVKPLYPIRNGYKALSLVFLGLIYRYSIASFLHSSFVSDSTFSLHIFFPFFGIVY